MAEGPGQRAHRRVGTMIRDKYRIDAFIATGSMANVYAATHRNGSRVALKVLHRELGRDPSMAERFRREGYFANAIGHPGVVRAIDDDVAEDGCTFIVMELLEGENLEERRQRLGGRVPLAEALQIADAMLDVLSAAHAHEVLHRDLKPENIFLTRKNEVKLLDFGVARFNAGRRSSEMTDTGMVLGTPAFMPPEQALGRREDVDVRSDIWAAGATLFTVIAGQSVHLGGDAKTKLIATARTPARRIREVAPKTPRAVASVIDRALAFDKAERWADAAAMREALRWARMSLDGETSTQLERLDHDASTPPVPTRRTPDDEPTLAGRPQSHSAFDESRAKHRTAPVASPPPSDGAFTSVAPTTQREHPPSMAMSEDPTFSLRNDPVFSLRPSPELAPITERVPSDYAEERPTSPGSQAMPAPAALFEAALADSPLAFDDDSFDARTLPRFDPRAARESASAGATEAEWKRAAPRPAAGAPPEMTPRARSAPPAFAPHAHPKTSPSMRTAPGIGPPARATNPDDPTLSGPHSSVPPAAAGREVRSAPPPNVATTGQRASGPPAAASAEVRSAPPLNLAATAPFIEAPAPLVGAPRNVAARPSGAPASPGPLLATIVPKRSGGIIRVLVPIAIGLLAGVVTYALAVRHREANASRVSAATATATATATPTVTATATATMTADPATVVSAQSTGSTTTALDAPTAAPSPSEAAPSAAAAAMSAPPKKARPRPKKPTSPATPDGTSSEPTPTPPPPDEAPPERDTTD